MTLTIIGFTYKRIFVVFSLMKISELVILALVDKEHANGTCHTSAIIIVVLYIFHYRRVNNDIFWEDKKPLMQSCETLISRQISSFMN